jgi:MFS family permease
VVSAVLVALALNTVLPADDLQAWGWRVPFVLGILIAPMGFYLRTKVPETPHFKAETEVPGHPLREALTIHRRTVLTISGMVVIWTVAGYAYGTFLVSFASQVLEVPSRYALLGTLTGALCNVAVIPLAGWASDKVGRKPFLLASAAGFALVSIPLFMFMTEARSGSPSSRQRQWRAFRSFQWDGTDIPVRTAADPRPLHALSVGYSGAVMLFGGFAPFIATLLVRITGVTIAPAFYVTAAAVLSFLVIACVRAQSCKGHRPMRLTRTFLLATCLTLAAPAFARQKARADARAGPGPSHGEDRYVPSYDDMMAYWKALAAVSDRVKLVDIGPSTEGRRQIMAVVSSPENLAKLDEYRETSRALGAAEGIDAGRARIMAAGKALVWIDGGLHASEVEAQTALIARVHDLVSSG